MPWIAAVSWGEFSDAGVAVVGVFDTEEAEGYAAREKAHALKGAVKERDVLNDGPGDWVDLEDFAKQRTGIDGVQYTTEEEIATHVGYVDANSPLTLL